MGYRPKRLLGLLAVVAEIAGDFQVYRAAGTAGALTAGIEQVFVPVPVLDFVVEIAAVETGSSADLERKPAVPLVKIVHALVAAVRMPAEIQDMVKTGQRACYLPAAPLEPLGHQVGLPELVRVHSFHKYEHPPVARSHSIDNVAYKSSCRYVAFCREYHKRRGCTICKITNIPPVLIATPFFVVQLLHIICRKEETCLCQ